MKENKVFKVFRIILQLIVWFALAYIGVRAWMYVWSSVSAELPTLLKKIPKYTVTVDQLKKGLLILAGVYFLFELPSFLSHIMGRPLLSFPKKEEEKTAE